MHRILLIFWLAKKLVFTAVRLLTHNFVITHADLPSFCVSVLVCVCVCIENESESESESGFNLTFPLLMNKIIRFLSPSFVSPVPSIRTQNNNIRKIIFWRKKKSFTSTWKWDCIESNLHQYRTITRWKKFRWNLVIWKKIYEYFFMSGNQFLAIRNVLNWYEITANYLDIKSSIFSLRRQ